MSSTNSLSSRLEELRSRNPQSPPGESIYSGYSTPNRFSGSFIHTHSHSLTASNENRATLQRRFTADSNTFPTPLSPINNHHLQSMDSIDMSATTIHKANALDKKRIEIEGYREKKKRIEEELKKFNNLQELHEEEYVRMANDMQNLNFSSGHQSEPATPPEYKDSGYSSVYPNRNRFSSSSFTSPPGLNKRLSRSGSQVTSPPSEANQAQGYENDADKLPSKSVPTSRRGSSDRFSQLLAESSVYGPRITGSNRYSMPVSLSMRQKRESVPDVASSMGLSHIDTTRYLFDDDEDSHKDAATSPDVKSYLQANTTEDKFPILVRSNHKDGILSASSAALDLAFLNSSDGNSEAKTKDGWPSSFARHRYSLQGVPQTLADSQQFMDGSLASPSASSEQSVDTVVESPTAARYPHRHSMEATMAFLSQKGVSASSFSSASSSRPNLASMVTSSYSTNDIPTLKASSNRNSIVSITSPSKDAESTFHKHNASLGRIPPGAMNKRLSRDLTIIEDHQGDMPALPKQLQSDLQANAAPFGPSMMASSAIDNSLAATIGLQQYNNLALYNGYGMQTMGMGPNSMQVGAGTGYGNAMQLYQAQGHYGSYGANTGTGRVQDSQTRVIQQRRLQNGEDGSRFNNAKIEQFRGDILNLCKDQHGCRFLQKQLESRVEETVQIIFLETAPHVVELMTDPFGNYLCQKLLEHSNDDQRTVLVSNAAPEMVQIALNQHGTRALQKMIEYLSTKEQIKMVIEALNDKVVELIQDLNGNHVIQKCLNRLMAEDAQFIFNAVGKSCIIVGTHRHGCCVLQRCIDHATGTQRADLIASITQNAFNLVQDPFGNYVLQYIIDLNESGFTNPLCYSFQTRIVELSKHKFSSNVIEKCIRHAEPTVGTMMIEEMMNANELEKMLRDSYANYVVQTALDHAEAETRARLVEAIRPILPSIRQTPHGRRIQSKIMTSENSSSMSSPVESPMPQNVVPAHVPNAHHGRMGGSHRPNGFYGAHNNTAYGMNMMPNYSGYSHGQFQGMNNGYRNGPTNFPFAPINNSNQNQQFPAFNRTPQATGFNFF